MASGSTSTLDLSRLAAPRVVEELDFETILAASIADLSERWPDFNAALESDPTLKLLQVASWRELLLRARINDAARSVMLAYAGGSDLDHLGALLGVTRRQIQPASDDTLALLESDAELRARIQIAPETLPYAGITAAGYRARSLAIDPAIKDVAALKRGQGRVDIILLGREGDGTLAPNIVSKVAASFREEDAVQLTDVVSVRAASITRYAVALRLLIGRGPDPALVKAEAEAAIRAYAARRHAIGQVVYAQQLGAAASVGGVDHVEVAADDIDPGASGAAWLESCTITVEIAA
ncbi:baseplate assembly protein [Altericroceibacterium endophyticum]|uniref:Baseplate assembly protein n=1 Tax=Altericroceibacterium endophyticum TaxID=1808508 RepID=A0A6I4T3J7_9SPHN|nr:baseplate J/gp47 family protein [Altericroceibacterium endophyticum]MXO64849.1 baseplate assembly protein [Altericroceibacterium endophyticum]